MGNVCGGTKSYNDSPTHHRLGSVSEPTPRPQEGSNIQQAPRSSTQASRPPAKSRSSAQTAGSADDRERRAQAAEERAKAAAARGTHSSNPNQGKLAAKVNKPVEPINQREEEPLRWD